MPHDTPNFGQYMEDEVVALAALDSDETAINQYDLGFTFARTATEIKLGVSTRKGWATRDFEPGALSPVAGVKATRMSARELAWLEAQEEAEDQEAED